MVGEPGGRVRTREDVRLLAEVAHDAEGVIQHPLPHLCGDHGRDRPWHEHYGSHGASSTETRVNDERDDQPQHELERDRDQRELDRDDDRMAEVGVVPDPARTKVVVEPDPLRRRNPGEELLVSEALVDRLAERIDRDKCDRRERRQKQ